MRAKQIIAVSVLLIIALLILAPPLLSGSVNVAISSSSSVSAEHLYLTLGEIKAHKAGTSEPSGWSLVTNASRQIDLAVANASQSAALGSLPLGEYDTVRVRVTNATVIVNNTSKQARLASSVFTIPVAFLVQFGAETPVMLKVTAALEDTPDGPTLELSFTASPVT